MGHPSLIFSKTYDKINVKELLKRQTEKEALTYLKSKVKKKGEEIEYKILELQEYLRPETKLKLHDKKYIFKIRTRMLEIKTNMKAKYDKYWCEACQEKGKTKTETQEHI